MSVKAEASSERVRILKNENASLKAQLKDIGSKVETFEADLDKSTTMITRLEKLSSELQTQSKDIRAESVASIKDAEERGHTLATEMTNNMDFMDTINENLKKITGESLQARKENEELGSRLGEIKEEYEKREQVLQAALQEMCDELVKSITEVAQVRLKNAEDKERLLGDMQLLSTTLVQSREQMKEAKETELKLRMLLQSYDEKFAGLQNSLKDTNTSYTGFQGEMDKVSQKTRDLGKETADWQVKWANSNAALSKMEQNHSKLQSEFEKATDGLTTMTNLCKALQKERKEMLIELKREEK